jgi:hypothetical protein
VAGQRDRPGRAYLEFTNGRDSHRLRADQAPGGGQREFQVREPAALAPAGAVLANRVLKHHAAGTSARG